MNFFEIKPVSLYLDELIVIEEIKSQFHNILLCEHQKLGKVLIIDKEIMHVENYEAFYHEPLVHLPFAINPRINSVLILGGGSLFAAKEALKYNTVDEVVLCDHDKEVLRLIARHYSHSQSVLNDKRFCYVEQDALHFLHNNKRKFDLIINDCFDLSEVYLDGVCLYDVLDDALSEGGLCSDMIYGDIFDNYCMSNSMKHLKNKCSKFYSLMCIPEYPGILHLHAIWSKSQITINYNHISSEQKKLFKNNEFKLFNPYYLQFYFYLPKFVKDIIK